MANMTAAFIVGVLVPIGHMDGARAERWAGAVVGALLAVANFRFFSEFECRFKFGLGGLYRVDLMCKDEATARERAKALV
jgi:hypothetical protein